MPTAASEVAGLQAVYSRRILSAGCPKMRMCLTLSGVGICVGQLEHTAPSLQHRGGAVAVIGAVQGTVSVQVVGSKVRTGAQDAIMLI